MRHNILWASLLALTFTAGFISCDDETVKQPLDAPAVSNSAKTFNSLSFSWEKIKNAIQYGYKLTDPEGQNIATGVTKSTSVTISGLQAATTYTLEVWAFAGLDTDYSSAPAITLTATTEAQSALQKPSVKVEGIYASWDAVPDAEEYAFTISGPSGETIASGKTTDTFTPVYSPAAGICTVSVEALTSAEGFLPGEPTVTQFEMKESYSVTGTYYSARLQTSRDVTMVAFTNNSYALLSYYGVEGANLYLAITSDDTNPFNILNGQYGTTAGLQTWQVPTGLSDPSFIETYPWGDYSSFSGDQTAGQINIGGYMGENLEDWVYDTFTWPNSQSGMKIDDIVGTYTCQSKGESSINDKWELMPFDFTDKATIAKVDDRTVEVDGIFWTGYPVTGIVDLAEMTITFQPQDYDHQYYYFASASGANEPVTAYINGDGSISVPDFCLWSYFENDGWYWYAYGSAELQKEK